MRRVSKASGKISTVAGNGYGGLPTTEMAHATAATILPVGLAVDRKNNLYISDANGNAVYVVPLN